MTPIRPPLRALAGLFLAAVLAACAEPAPERPRLVVLVSVDQLRYDLVDRYRHLWTGGLDRILTQGRRYSNTTHDHAVTKTAPGHATLATGVVPARHGIVGNDWWEPRDDGSVRERYAVGDPDAPVVGVPRAEGRSPAAMLRDGVADWMLRADSATRILSLSTKDRAAITLGGRTPGSGAHVYWFLESEARFVTSTWYRGAYPSWLEAFNRRELPALLDSVWETRVPPEARRLTRPDTAEHEWRGEHTYFPHRFLDEAPGTSVPDFGEWVKHTPFPDQAVLELARTGIRELGLGADGVTDYLALGLSQTDYVGHRFGPLSREQLDNLLRLDQALGRFLAFLDREVGRDRWVLAFTADHGVAPVPEYAEEPGLRISREAEDSVWAAAERARAGAPDESETARRVARALGAFAFVRTVRTEAELQAAGEPQDSFLRMDRHSYHPGRVPRDLGRYRVLVTRREGTLWPDSDDATTHGSPYLYDRRVPLAFLGPGVEPGVVADPVRSVDVAPTLAALAWVVLPEDLDGGALLVPEPSAGPGR